MTDDGDGGAVSAAARGRGRSVGGPAGRGESNALSPQARDRIAGQLRAMYASVAEQPVPDRFAELIAKLDSGDRSRS